MGAGRGWLRGGVGVCGGGCRAGRGAGGRADNPTGLYIGSYDNLQIYTCPNSPSFPYPGGGHGHTTLIQ